MSSENTTESPSLSDLEENQKRNAARLQELLNKRILTGAILQDQPLTENEVDFLLDLLLASIDTQLMVPLVETEPPIVVVGDLHGHYKDLLRILDQNGYPPQQRYLFLGNYVDYGEKGSNLHQLETIATVFALRLAFPRDVFILRGNHETEHLNKSLGFKAELTKRFGDERLFRKFNMAFNGLGLAALIGGRVFCVHSGISKELHHFNQIRRIPLPTEVPSGSLLEDFLWSDPSELINGFTSDDRFSGKGHWFGADEVEKFCQNMGVEAIVRGNQVDPSGYKVFALQRCITIFSAVNYMEQRNDGSYVIIEPGLKCNVKKLPFQNVSSVQ